MEEVDHEPKVADAMVPSQYRVYPATPLTEVVDLIVRRGLHAVPVVGDMYEVLGILTSGDALAFLMSWGPPGEEDREPVLDESRIARDVMTRSVLCVSEDEPLSEAANKLVTRDVEQLPVVREGEFVGFVTRDSALRALSGVKMPADDGDSTLPRNDDP